ncbi:hypothetical protein OYT09_01190 [Paenibacillus polymyxa]|nr:hypothetical protein [Paenibacillus polymyxa]WCM61648.1 hypothetical protein OYT09_01190 [Paenibacillus polymyxa]
MLSLQYSEQVKESAEATGHGPRPRSIRYALEARALPEKESPAPKAAG